MTCEDPAKICWPDELPESLTGKKVVVIDILAATTNIATFLDIGVGTLLLTNDGNVIVAKEKYPDAFVIGESSKPQVAAILTASNSPALLEKNDILAKIAGKTVLYLTNNGTKVISRVVEKGARIVTAASFVNVEKVLNWLRDDQLKDILLVPAGEINLAGGKAEEDYLCAKAIYDALRGRSISWQQLFNKIKRSIRKNYLPLYKRANLSATLMEKDIQIITKLNSHNLVPICKRRTDGLIFIT
jgi:phosphosulfolactate phosphohydrolase-like enzyme